jgi:hypothetical protein
MSTEHFIPPRACLSLFDTNLRESSIDANFVEPGSSSGELRLVEGRNSLLGAATFIGWPEIALSESELLSSSTPQSKSQSAPFLGDGEV